MICGYNVRDDDVVGVMKLVLITTIAKNCVTFATWHRHPSMLAVTSCKYERSISYLYTCILKTRLCSTISVSVQHNYQ